MWEELVLVGMLVGWVVLRNWVDVDFGGFRDIYVVGMKFLFMCGIDEIANIRSIKATGNL